MTSMMISLFHNELKNRFNMLWLLQLWLIDSLTSFRPYPKNIITAAIEGMDTLVVQPTGSGKSLYFFFHLFI